MNNIKIGLMLFGIFSIIIILVVIIIIIVTAVRELIFHLHIRHIIKHRFDKPPIAKCYCKDCKMWGDEGRDGMCVIFKWRTADNWFCWKAEPRPDSRIQI